MAMCDGIPDINLTDYDGGINMMIGIHAKTGTKRYFHQAKIPRLFLRRSWVDGRLEDVAPNASLLSKQEKNGTHDEFLPRDHPFHSYFEYSEYNLIDGKSDVLQGVTADILGQDDVKGSTER